MTVDAMSEIPKMITAATVVRPPKSRKPARRTIRASDCTTFSDNAT